ncbi:uncharacterized protein F4817DRAFT_354990, partial [Daldinia loculata]|uniref:uncharacterized protein n=1 Tax=Daldinia loculata TaxID=103429 RepID=UPI0020C4A008
MTRWRIVGGNVYGLLLTCIWNPTSSKVPSTSYYIITLYYYYILVGLAPTI